MTIIFKLNAIIKKVFSYIHKKNQSKERFNPLLQFMKINNMNIKILFNSFKVLIAPVIVILMFKFFNYLELDSTDNNSYIYGLFLGTIIYIILNKRKKYVCDFKVKNDLYEIKYYNMFGLKREITLSKDFDIDFLSKKNMNGISDFVRFFNKNETYDFYYLDSNIKKVIENYKSNNT